MTIVITDCEYRSVLALVQTLGAAGHRLILCQNSEKSFTAPAFSSRYAAQCHHIDAKADTPAYRAALREICTAQGDRPVLLTPGAKTLEQVAAHRAEFDSFARLLAPSREALDHANNKAYVQQLAASIGVPTPRTYSDIPDHFPVIIKPTCGEKLGLKTPQRYVRADDLQQYRTEYARMCAYDPDSIVQEYIAGEGIGVSLAMDQRCQPIAVLCHRRIREYPVSGGPSTCCETFYDEQLVQYSVRLLQALHFTGIAMVEYKGTPGNYRLLEINPRIWGSFPLTRVSGSRLALRWAQAAAGEVFSDLDSDYARPCRMRFALNDTVSVLALLKAGRGADAVQGIRDALSPRVAEALKNKADPRPFRAYQKSALRRQS